MYQPLIGQFILNDARNVWLYIAWMPGRPGAATCFFHAGVIPGKSQSEIR